MNGTRSVHRGVRYALQAYEILQEEGEMPSKELSPIINKRYNEKTTPHSLGWLLRYYGRDYKVKSRVMSRVDKRLWRGNPQQYGGQIYLFYVDDFVE